MAMSSVRGGITSTSGSDAGTLPSLRTAFICTSEEVVAALTIRPLPDSLDEALFTLLEQAFREGQDPDPERFVRELADALFTHPLEGIDGLAELRDHVEDIDGEGLRTYVAQWIYSLGAGHGKRLLDQDAVAIIENYIPPMVSSVVLQNAFMKGLPSAPRLTKDYRWEQLSAKRELKSLCQSPFSKGWWNRSLQGHQAASVFRSPVSEISQATPRREVRMSEGNGSPTKTSVETSDPPDLVSQQRRHTAAKNADKAATAFDGGSFKGVADKRGFSGFWRQLEGKLLRRG
ncbi:hypothetical protein Pmar_PMAR009687 [Perkinsus marinus ATCC 50983]|uniref:Uncharacterized protein n=1 Tax=Perkinsus marinus (strain ATCC 50983 / TXsc) TaxID=423536 RepID=C5KNP7_PERM5|nr:hypothetical protein Pmar_PMAR009687 [Perkinsus marinus ATCC 50983]EER13897.1 hypothetical protein Pmar_PMAR009687 [Perkinsus marinus ATCC 50983]|eukprot:XP_002782102.1 hypothetical protein Pmar_PMAR009687 [Perkinsus marinus ATCC 50983]